MRTYEIPTDPKLNGIIIAYENGMVFSIPKDPANSDYQAYLASIAEDTNADI